MDDLFQGFGADFDDLKPAIQQRAVELAKHLIDKEGYDKEKAITESIKQAEEEFLDLEG